MNCILTIACGDLYQKMSLLTHPLMKAYAQKIGASFISIEQSSASSPHWEKFNGIFSLLNRYERLIYCDTDIIIRDDCPNLFDIVPPEQIGLFNELPFTKERRELSLIDACKEYGFTLKDWDGKYYNTGVMVVSRQHKQLFKKPDKEIFNFYEQGYFNAILAKTLCSAGNELTPFQLQYKFNRMCCMDPLTGEERFASYIIHYAGFPNPEMVLTVIKNDIEKWRFDAPEYKYQRHILVDVQGGLGDQMCAQPAIRFMKKYIYPDDDINIVTHYPVLFESLGLPVFQHGEFKPKPDTPYYSRVTLPGPETIMWTFCSNLLSHTVDFASMVLLRRILPNNEKNFELAPDLTSISEVLDVVGMTDLSKLILVHAGRHWESKTFPISWWQEVIDKLQESGHQVCLIGQDEHTRGVLKLEAREGMLDTRNLLSLNGLIALISAARILVSNDSAGIHLAGAFDNYIILIPTCKHPDHILPYRNGNQYYKAFALYKKLLSYEYDSSPTSVHGSLGDKLIGKWEDYLPDVSTVIETVKSIYETS